VVTTRGMWLTLVAMTLASSMILVDQTAVPLASPDVVQGLGGNIANGQWILTANILPLAAFMVLGGRLGDLFGLRRVFLSGAVVFAVAIVALIYCLSRGQPDGWGSSSTLGPLLLSIVAFAVFGWVESRSSDPLINFRLFRHLNFLASTISQVLAGALELGLGFLLPFYLLLVVGVGPVVAGIALIPGTIPIILAGPMAGRLFDQRGGRGPLVGGFLVLALSGLALGLGATGDSAVGLIPGLLLQGVGLGVVLTVNDPVGMNAVEEGDRGQAAGIINTAEQLGGALGIAGLGALQLGYYFHLLYHRLSQRGIAPTPAQVKIVHDFIAQAEVKGLNNVPQNSTVRYVLRDLVSSHATSFQVAFYASGAIGLLGALACAILVRQQPRTLDHPIFGRRSRWLTANAATTPGLTRLPPEAFEH